MPQNNAWCTWIWDLTVQPLHEKYWSSNKLRIPDFPGVAVVELLAAPVGSLISSSLGKKITCKIFRKILEWINMNKSREGMQEKPLGGETLFYRHISLEIYQSRFMCGFLFTPFVRSYYKFFVSFPVKYASLEFIFHAKHCKTAY